MEVDLKAYIKPKLLRRYIERYRNDPLWAWQTIKRLVGEATNTDKREIIDALENVSIVKRALNAAADEEAETMLQDDNLSLQELNRILGKD